MLDKAFGNRLRSLRKSAKKNETYTQKQAARDIGVGYKSLQNHEAGRLPGKASLQKYLDFFKCDKVWLLTGIGEPFPGEEVSDKPSIGKFEEIKYRKIDDSFGIIVDALREIFDSHDLALIDAIRSNIYIFRSYARKDHQLRKLSNDIKDLQKKYNELKKVVEELECKKNVSESL